MALFVTLTGRVTLMNETGVVQEHDLAGRLGRMVFARLALAQHPVARLDLVDELWPHGAPTAAESVLNATLSRLRQALGAIGVDGKSVLVSTSGVVELRLPIGSFVDVHSAHRAVDAAEAALRREDFKKAWSDAVVGQAIARRPFLTGIDRFWIDMERNRLDQLHNRASSVLIDVWTALGDARQRVAACQEFVSRHPFIEDSHRRLVLAFLASGDRGAAADAVTRCETLLERELGLRPDGDLRRLLHSN